MDVNVNVAGQHATSSTIGIYARVYVRGVAQSKLNSTIGTVPYVSVAVLEKIFLF